MPKKKEIRTFGRAMLLHNFAVGSRVVIDTNKAADVVPGRIRNTGLRIATVVTGREFDGKAVVFDSVPANEHNAYGCWFIGYTYMRLLLEPVSKLTIGRKLVALCRKSRGLPVN